VGLTDRSIDGMGIEMGDLFLRSSKSHPTMLGQREMLSHTACDEHVYVMCVRFLLHDVHRFESSQLSDMSNPLSYGHRHVVNVSRW
jgi:hypothetical protein